MSKKTALVHKEMYDQVVEELAEANKKIDTLMTLTTMLFTEVNKVSAFWMGELYIWAKSKDAEYPGIVTRMLEGTLFVFTKLQEGTGMTPDELKKKYSPKKEEEDSVEQTRSHGDG